MGVTTTSAAAQARKVGESSNLAFGVLPAVELAVLVSLVAAPFVLAGRAELVTLMTNIVILSLFAISFDLCWGFSGIMSFGQALFFGAQRRAFWHGPAL